MDGVLFDPGFSKHLTSFFANIQFVYEKLNKYKNMGQKKVQFKLFLPQIINLLDTYIAFYLGCMLWAGYIKSLSNKKIIEHPCLGEKYDEEKTFSEINFIKEYLIQLKKDCKYYLSQDFEFTEKKHMILNLYQNFLKENKGFVEIDNTDKIILPKELQNFSDLQWQEFNEKIQEVVKTGKISDLLIFIEKI